MASLNKVILIGNLGQDPEVRYTPSGAAVANFSIATSESWTDKSGERQEKTEWHRIVVWGKQAELCGEYLRKGRSVCIEGRIESRDWQDRDGNKRTTVEIKAQSVTFLGGRGEMGGGARSNGNYRRDNDGGGYGGGQPEDSKPFGGFEPAPMDDSDIPF